MRDILTQTKQYPTCDIPAVGCVPAASSRRSFLLGSVGALLATAVSTEGRAQSRALSTGASGATLRPESLLPPIAVGYWSGSDAGVVSALRLMQGDRTMIEHGVHVTVYGLSDNCAEPQIAVSTLMAHFQTDAVSAPNKFYAWRYSQEVLYYPKSAVSFTMPLDQTHEIALSLDYFWQDDPDRDSPVRRCEDMLRLSVDPQSGKLKLRPGLYFVALPDLRKPQLPNWDACRFLPEYKANSLVGGTLVRQTAQGLKPIENPYLMLSIAPVFSADPDQKPEETEL